MSVTYDPMHGVQPVIVQRSAVRFNFSENQSVKRTSVFAIDSDNHVILITQFSIAVTFAGSEVI
ncbi:MAG: hypothetical protein JO333_20740 [Verrucomicrobia bacterium]|nr:hypothetical protein [Verrucomicrobiota bacterium]